MAGCGRQIMVWVNKGYSGKEIPYKCGNTGIDGFPEFCEECEKKYSHVNWVQEAHENGECFYEDEY